MDHDLNELKRRFLDTGSVEDEARLLQARVRAGELSEKRLRAAALVAHPAAVAILGPAPSKTPALWPIHEWANALGDLGWRVSARAALAVALSCLEQTRQSTEALNPETPQDPFALPTTGNPFELRTDLYLADLLQEAIVCPDEELDERIGEWAHHTPAPCGQGAWRLQRSALEAGFQILSQRTSKPFITWWWQTCLTELEREGHDLHTAFEVFRGGEASSLAELNAIRDELAPPLLAYRDPIAERRARCLERAELAYPCPTPEVLPHDGRVFHCQTCELNVFDISGMTRAEAEALIRTATGRLCLSLYRRADGKVQTQDCPSGRSLPLADGAFEAVVDGGYWGPSEGPDPFGNPPWQDPFASGGVDPFAPPPEDS